MRYFLIAVLALSAFLLWAQSGKALTARTLLVDEPLLIKATGTLVATRRSALSFRVAGVVKRVLVDVGDEVKIGEVLAELDDSDYRLQVRQYEAQVEAAKAQVEAAKASYEMAKKGFREEEVGQVEALVEAARAQVEMMRKGFRKEQVESARAGVEAAQAAYDLAKKDLERMRRLFEKGAVARRSYDAAVMQERAAAAQLQSAKWQLALLEHGFREEEIKSALANLKRAQKQFLMMKKGLRVEQVEQAAAAYRAAQSQLRLAEIGLQWAKRQLQYCKLRAPFDGIVVNKMVASGTYVVTMMRTPVIELLDPKSIEAWIDVPDKYAQVVKKGQKVVIEADGGPGRLEGVVVGTSPAMSLPERKFIVRVALKTTDGLMAGMFVNAKIYAGKRRFLAVPVSALRRDGVGEYLLCVRGGRAVKIYVRTESQRGELAAITVLKGSLKEGEPVVVSEDIREGDKVEER